MQADSLLSDPPGKPWSGLSFPPPGDLPDPGIEPASPALQADSLPLNHLGGQGKANSDSIMNLFLLLAFVIIIIDNGLHLRILPLCLTVKLKFLCSELYPPVGGRKKEINTSPCLKLTILGDICKINGLFYFVSSPLPVFDI